MAYARSDKSDLDEGYPVIVDMGKDEVPNHDHVSDQDQHPHVDGCMVNKNQEKCLILNINLRLQLAIQKMD
jgi:hypothetical protein